MKQTFAGDQRNYDPDSYIGANGRFFRPVSAEYDGTRTVIEYERIPFDEMGQRYGHLIDKAQDKAMVVQLFGGQW